MIITLDEHLRNQIAAGEVVERPASIVKELTENALDAHARTVKLFLSKQSLSFEIHDDGNGIPSEELPLAVKRHTTSKIASARDLQNINSLGFRGEALASIASVSRFTIESTHVDESRGRSLHIAFGTTTKDTISSLHKGTHIEVSHIFDELPARKKFLKTVPTELKHIRQEFIELALGWPTVSFILYEDHKEVFNAPATVNAAERVTQVYPDLQSELLDFTVDGLDYDIKGIISKPKHTYKRPYRCHFFINNRPVQSHMLLKAVKDAYYTIIPDNTYPACFLHITLDPLLVDVNVHPRKKEVKFSNPQDLFSLVNRNIKLVFSTSDIISHFTVQHQRKTSYDSSPQSSNSSMRLFDGSRQSAIEQTTQNVSPMYSHISDVRFLAQIKQSYLLFEDSKGLVIVDQHAMHERINYEKLKENRTRKTPHKQQLLIPLVFDVPPTHAPLFTEIISILTDTGFDIESLSGNSFQIRSIPDIFKKVSFESCWQDILEDLTELKKPEHIERLVDETLHRIACRSSIMFNDPVSPQEAIALWEHSMEIDVDSSCPHGRPTKFRLSYTELEKFFLR